MELNDSDKMIIAMSNLTQMNIYRCSVHGVFSKTKAIDNDSCTNCGIKSINITQEVTPLQSLFREEFGDGPWNY